MSDEDVKRIVKAVNDLFQHSVLTILDEEIKDYDEEVKTSEYWRGYVAGLSCARRHVFEQKIGVTTDRCMPPEKSVI